MSKVTFSLVGGQPFPVYAQVLDSKPDILLLFHSAQTKQNAENIEQCLKRKLPALRMLKIEVDAKDLNSSNLTFEAYAKAWLKPENEITVNLSGGTKPWSLQLYSLFNGKEGAKCVFIDQNNLIWDMKTFSQHKLDHSNISFDDKFALYGVKAPMRTSFDEYTDADFVATKQIEKLYHIDRNALRSITEKIKNEENEGHLKGDFESGDCRISRIGRNEFSCKFEHWKYHYKKKVRILSPHAAQLLLNTGWFELKVAHILNEWEGARKIWLNTQINYNNQDNTVNEIDIIVETINDKLLFVECKTFVHDSTDIDKFNDVIKSYGGLGGKRIFVTLTPMEGLPASKCDILKIPRFSTKVIQNDNNSVLTFHSDLNRYINSINDR